MHKNRNLKASVLLLLLLSLFPFKTFSQDKMLDILSDELQRESTALKKLDVPPYYMHYRVNDVYSVNIRADFGSLISSTDKRERILTPEIRVGTPEMDNTRELRDDYSSFFSRRERPVLLPIEDGADAIRQAIWKTTNSKYQDAVEKLAKVKANVTVKVETEDKSNDFSVETPSVYYEEPFKADELNIDKKKWEDKLKKYSQIFLNDPHIYEGTASIAFQAERKYFVSTEGSKLAHNNIHVRISIYAVIKADDGMELPLHKTYFAYSEAGLPTDETIIKDVNAMAVKLQKLRNAPIVDSYSGPALMSSASSGVFFHEIFGHRVEAKRLKSENDAQTFKKKVGQDVLQKNLSVFMDPTILQYKGKDLNGSYKYDDEGVKAQRVDIVKDGKLMGFLTSRTPIEGFSKSNGHGRAQAGMETVTRQSNLIVETNNPKTEAEIKQALIDEAKKQGKEYGYYFAEVTGGFTMTGRYLPNSFNVMPTEVYRVYVDGRPDELVRGVDLVGTPLAMFSEIESAGDSHEIFTGTCGAESGWVPVTCIAPAVFIKKIEMQRKEKSQDRPQILPRPGVPPVSGN